MIKRFDNEYYYKNNSKIYDDENFVNLIKIIVKLFLMKMVFPFKLDS